MKESELVNSLRNYLGSCNNPAAGRIPVGLISNHSLEYNLVGVVFNIEFEGSSRYKLSIGREGDEKKVEIAGNIFYEGGLPAWWDVVQRGFSEARSLLSAHRE